MRKLLIAIAAVAVIFTACGSSTSTDTVDPIENVAPANSEVANFVNAYERLHPGTVAEFCGYAYELGESTTRDAFVEGFTSEYPDVAYANSVFDELMSRC